MYVVIPPDYARRGVVPICISDTDDEGRRVVQGWIAAVNPIADPLRRMSASVTGDVRNVSQVTEEAVHSLSALRGLELGTDPSKQVYSSATWRARLLKHGGRRQLKRLDVEFRDLYIDCVQTRPEFVAALERQNLIERLTRKALDMEREDLAIMIDLYLSEAEDQIPTVFGVSPNSRERNTLTKKLYRGLRKVLASL